MKGWSNNVHGGLAFNRVYWQNDVFMNNTQYYHALGMHGAYSGIGTADFRIPYGARTFRTGFGLAMFFDDVCSGNVYGKVYIDGQQVWGGSLNGPTNATLTNLPDISIPYGALMLRLEDNAFDNPYCAHATWADPQFRP